MSTTPAEPKPKKTRRKKKFWTSEKILSLSAIMMSAATLAVLLYQTNLMRKQQYMSVYPYLEIRFHGAYGPNYRFELTNNGIGPALLKKIRVHHKGEVYEEDWANYLRKTISKKDSLVFSYTNLSTGRLIPPNQSLEIIKLKAGGSKAARKLDSYLRGSNIRYEVEYESIYGEAWILSSSDPNPRKLD